MKPIDQIYMKIRHIAFMGPVKFYSSMNTPENLIHIGAHLAQEKESYESQGFKNLFWIEANPDVFSILQSKVGSRNCSQSLLWSESGIEKTFYISNNEVSSSAYNFLEGNAWPELAMTRKIKLETNTFSNLVNQCVISEEMLSKSLVVLDTQGSELEVLIGFDRRLNSVTAICVEVSKKKFYDGGADYKDINSFLKQSGFRRIAAWIDPLIGHGDALFISNSKEVPLKYVCLGKCIWLCHITYFAFRALNRRGILKLNSI